MTVDVLTGDPRRDARSVHVLSRHHSDLLRPRSMEMAKGEIPDGPKDDYRNSLREKNGMRCAAHSVAHCRLTPFSLLKYETLPHFKISTSNSMEGWVKHYICLIVCNVQLSSVATFMTLKLESENIK